MSTVAYCSECNTRVTLTSAGLCPNGHPRPSLRDVRTLPDDPPHTGINPSPRGHTEPPYSRSGTLARAGLLALFVILLVLATIALLLGGFLVFWSFPLPTEDLGALGVVVAQLAGVLLVGLALSLYSFAWLCHRALHASDSPRRRWVTVLLVMVAFALLAPSVLTVAAVRGSSQQADDVRLHSGNVPWDYAGSLTTWDQSGLELLGDVPISQLRPIHEQIVDTIGTGYSTFGGGTDSVYLGTACTVEGPNGAGTIYVKTNPQTGRVTAVTFTPQP